LSVFLAWTKIVDSREKDEHKEKVVHIYSVLLVVTASTVVVELVRDVVAVATSYGVQIRVDRVCL
jgi:hypothetical protein